MKKLIILILIIFVGRYLYINNFRKEEWTGFFYPNAEDLSGWIKSDRLFDSIESCRDWIDYQVDVSMLENPEFYEEGGDYDYECGLNCRLKSGMNVCEETIQ